jgi:adenine/guanine phosphoribosyltransferase-like PRPP-binding protein
MIDAGYIPSAVFHAGDTRKELLDKFVALIENSGVSFDTIAFSGVSGALIAPLIADRLGKHLTVIRKRPEQERAHSSRPCEGWCDPQAKYIIVDDFLDTGATVRRIWRAMCDRNAGHCVGIFLYAGCNACEFFEEHRTEFVTTVWGTNGETTEFDFGYDPMG